MKSRCLLPNLCIAIKASSTKALVNVALPSIAGVGFEAFLRRTAKEILDCPVRKLISEADLIVFEEEASDVIV